MFIKVKKEYDIAYFNRDHIQGFGPLSQGVLGVKDTVWITLTNGDHDCVIEGKLEDIRKLIMSEDTDDCPF